MAVGPALMLGAQRKLLMLGTIQGALFLFMFRYIFGGAINPGNSIEYVDFHVPGSS